MPQSVLRFLASPCFAVLILTGALPAAAQTSPAPTAPPAEQPRPPFGPGFLRDCNGKDPTPGKRKFCQCYLSQVQKRYSEAQLQQIDSIVRSPTSGPNVAGLTAVMLSPERAACPPSVKP